VGSSCGKQLRSAGFRVRPKIYQKSKLNQMNPRGGSSCGKQLRSAGFRVRPKNAKKSNLSMNPRGGLRCGKHSAVGGYNVGSLLYCCFTCKARTFDPKGSATDISLKVSNLRSWKGKGTSPKVCGPSPEVKMSGRR